jgi:exopolysaccharide biosynthesis protein
MTHRRTRTVAALYAAILTLSGIAGPASVAQGSVVVPFAETGEQAIGPGTVRAWGQVTTDTGGTSAVQFIRVDPTAPNVHFEALLSNDTVASLETVASMASRATYEGHRVVAAVNGDFWSGSGGNLASPNGLHVHLGELMAARRSARPTFGTDASGAIRIGDVSVTTTFDFGTGTYLIGRVNQTRASNEVDLFTPRFGASTGTSANGTEVILAGVPGPITPTGTYPAIVQAVSVGSGDTPLAPGTLVLSEAGTNGILPTLVPGQAVTVKTAITPGWESVTEAIGGGQWILQDGVVGVSPPFSKANTIDARTGLGVTADGGVILATVDGAQAGYSAGVQLTELGQLLQAQGAVRAINFDGGGSTTLVARRPGDTVAGLVNRPSHGGTRTVTNALAVVSTAPTGPPAGLVIDPAPAATGVVAGSTTGFGVVAWDSAINAVPLLPSTVTWTASGGTIDAGGQFLATTPGVATVMAVVSGLSAQVTFPVTPSTDVVAPAAKAPITSFVTGWTAGQSAVAVRVIWPAATDPGGSIASYRLSLSTDDGPYKAVPLADPLLRETVVRVPTGRTYRLGVQAVDGSGNVSALAAGGPVGHRTVQESDASIKYSGTWKRQTGSTYYAGATRSATTAGPRATFAFSGSDVAWVATIGPDRGSARVYLDGSYVETVNLQAPARASRRVVYRAGWPTVGGHTLEIRPSGTAGHPRVDIDAFLVEAGAPVAPVLAGAGEIATCGSAADETTATVLGGIAGTIFTTGDNAYPNGSVANYKSCYGPSWGALKARTRPVPGQVDWKTSKAAGYFKEFGPAAGAPGRSWYAYDLGTWRIYALDSTCASNGGCAATKALMTWLRKDLAANPRACVLAYWNDPRFSSGALGNVTSMSAAWAALYAAGADVIVNGNDLDYERFAPQDPTGAADPARGIREFVVGTGGAGLAAFGTIQPNSELQVANAYGILKLILRPAGYEWTFVPAAGSSGTDSGWASCH